jgi:spore maturation protein CgeB
MRRAGYAPSVRLFEAAACATPVISGDWEGIDTFFTPGEEILISRTSRDTLRHLQALSEAERHAIGARARARMLAEHTAVHRAASLESYVAEAHRSRRWQSR